MSITYKDLLPDDISIQDYKSHKEWNVHFESTASYGLNRLTVKKHDGFGAYYTASQFFGNDEGGPTIQSTTGSSTSGPIYDRLLYSSLANTFYMTSSVSESFVAADVLGVGGSQHTNPLALEYHSGRITNAFYNKTTGYTTHSVYTLPTNIIGEGIKPGSLFISHSNSALCVTDDSKGNLFTTDAGMHVGNVFYGSGVFVMTFITGYSGQFYGDPLEASVGWRNFNFKSTLTMTEHEYYCTIQDGEYNQSVNPTILSGSNNGVAAGAEGTGSYILRNLVTGSAFSPYATTVGLYNDTGDLCATGKLARPLKISDQYDISIVVRFDA